MIILQLDPASLGLWFGLRGSGDQNADRVRLLAANAALRGDAGQVAQAVSECETESRARRSAAIASTMWHECRHFADIALTNFGAFKIRRYLTVYANIGKLASGLAQSGKLHCPVTDYMSDVTRLIYGLKEPDEDVMALLRDIAGRSRMQSEDAAMVPSPMGHISIGGKAQLEAIAYLCQSASIGKAIGLDAALNTVSDVPDPDTLKSNYGWVAALESLGLIHGFTVGENFGIISGEPLVPLLFASLCTRHWGQPQVETEYGGMGFPAGRLATLAQKLGPKWRRSWPDWSDAWNQVNDVSESIWGRSAIGELEEDIRIFGGYVEELTAHMGEESAPARWASDLYKLRVALLSLLRESPRVLLHLEEAPTLTGLLNVPFIAAAPHGKDYPLPAGYERLSGFSTPGERPDSGWWWAAARRFDQSGTGLGLTDFNAWAAIAADYAPTAKLLLQGRRHRIMLGPELMSAEQRIRATGTDLQFNPAFAVPGESNDLAIFWHFSESDTLICDFCRSAVERPRGAIISEWAFRVSRELAGVAIGGYGDGDEEAGNRRFVRDWSAWFACPACQESITAILEPRYRHLVMKGAVL